ncbi:MAG: general secretion pathway protein J [Flavobacteriales bacterium]|jgi:general secretion pathway protein J
MSKFSQKGFTLIELLISAVILSFIVIIAHQSIYTATQSGALAEKRSNRLRQLDRVWLLIEADVRNALAYEYRGRNGGAAVPALVIDSSGQYPFMLVRSGHANPLLLQRSEVIRVAYRLDEENLWRDTWTDFNNPDEDYARSQKLLEGVEELVVQALPSSPKGKSVADGPWFDSWPVDTALDELPAALEFEITLKGGEKLRRLLALKPGAAS